MRRYWDSFLCLLGTELVRSKPMDEASRKKRLRQTLERIPITYFVCAVVTSILVYFEVLRAKGFIAFAFVGLLFVKMRLRPLRQPLLSPYSWQFFVYLWATPWLSQSFVQLPHLPGWWGAACEGVLGVACAMSGLFTVSSLVTWAFREPFWQYMTGEEWPKKPSRSVEIATSGGSISAASVPASALPYNY